MSVVSEDPRGDVDLVINTFERTYRHALEPDVFTAMRDAHRFRFSRRVVLINNVADREDAAWRGARLLESGEVDEVHFVADRLDLALAQTGLGRGGLEPLLHYSDGPLVAATLPGSPWLLYWDPEARLAEPVDWITPALELMGRDERLMIANPSWEQPDARGRRPGVEREAVSIDEGFAVGHGFSDQVFLAARSALGRRIYAQRCIASITYPAAHKATVFEARVAAHMRHHGRLRATSLAASYLTDASQGSSSYPSDGVAETARLIRNAIALRLLRSSPWRPACLRHSWL